MRSFWVIVLLSFTSIGHSQEGVPAWFIGEWEGVGNQSNTDTSWPTLLVVEPGSEPPHVRYNSLECAGQWVFLGIEDDGRLKFREQITETIGQCSLDDYLWVTKRNDDQLFVEYAHSWAPQRVIASLILDRQLKP